MDKKFQIFTGSSRRPRQVNLSGRNNNPFAAVAGASTSRAPLSTHDAVAHAQQERRARQQERDRLQAVKTLQRIWRGHTSRREFRSRYRQEWDFREGIKSSVIVIEEQPYTSPSQALEQLRLLVRFASPSNQHDIQRMQRFATRCCKAHGTLPWKSTANNAGDWTYPLLFAAKICLVMLQKMYATLQINVLDDILLFLSEISKAIPGPLSLYSHVFYKTLSLIARQKFPVELIRSSQRGIFHMNDALLALLEADNPSLIGAYEGFVDDFLTTPDLHGCVNLKVLADGLNTRILTTTYKSLLMRDSGTTLIDTKTTEELSWLLAYFIYLRRTAPTGVIPRTPDADFVLIVSRLITHLPSDVLSRIDTAEPTSVGSLPLFIATELSTLVTQAGVQSLLRSLGLNPTPTTSHQKASSEAAALASYALTLLQFFPRRGDEIRMWLFQGTASRRKSLSDGSEVRVPAIKYFWEAVTRTDIFRLISDHPQNVLGLLTKANVPKNPSNGTSSRNSTTWEQEWRIIFLFFELYTFVLKVMDDEEFVNGSDSIEENQSWTRRSALTLAQVRDLTIFLKHLAYSMYWDAAKLIGAEDPVATTSLADYFGNTSVVSKSTSISGSVGKAVDADIAGVTGMRLTYVRGMVTGLLRMIYERE
jgi:ubiquitin-protein ligase E3 C